MDLFAMRDSSFLPLQIALAREYKMAAFEWGTKAQVMFWPTEAPPWNVRAATMRIAQV
ncbi:MAG TPA: hypothetical protein VE170_12000 [Candidatus Limnocylindria bacterium]|nr:hypothetical protein [Candidatus Limnocylindria bacterium]